MVQYTSTARRTGGFWTVQCDQFPGAISQVRRLDQAVEVHREAVAFVAGVDEADVEVTVRPVLDEGVVADLARSEDLHREAEQVEREARGLRVSAALRLKRSGLTVRDIGAVLGVSPQRAQQLVS